MDSNNPWQNENPWNKKNSDFSPDSLKDFLKKAKNFGGGFSNHKSKKIFWIIGGIIATIYFSSGFFQVQPNEKGVVLRFGKWVRTVGPGLRYALPYPFEMVLIPRVTDVRQIDISSSNNSSEKNLTLTGDSNLADITFSVLWKVKEDGTEQYLFCDRSPEITVKAVSESVMREIVGQTPFSYVQTEGRADIQNKARMNIQAVMDEYNMGVEIIRVELRQVEPPSSVIDAFRDVERAQAEQQSEKNKAEAYARDVKARTRGLIAKKINHAEAQKQKVIAKAKGTVARFLSAYEQYRLAPDIVSKRMYIESMQEILQNVRKIIIDDKIKTVSYLPLIDNKFNLPQTLENNDERR